MSLKKDGSGRRWVEVEVEVPGTPEEVWQAIATGPGVSSWFVPTEVRDDGTVISRFWPGMEAVASRTAWEPPHRFAAEGSMGPDTPPLATEWIVEARAGGTCVVRVVHSLFTSKEDWDDQLENIESGWPAFFQILRLYLSHFGGQPCSILQLVGVTTESVARAWDTFTGSLGLAGALPGERRTSPSSGPRLDGVVERVGSTTHGSHVLLRLDAPYVGIAHLFAFAMGPQTIVAVRIYFYGDHAPATVASNEPVWQAWLKEHFPPPVM